MGEVRAALARLQDAVRSVFLAAFVPDAEVAGDDERDMYTISVALALVRSQEFPAGELIPLVEAYARRYGDGMATDGQIAATVHALLQIDPGMVLAVRTEIDARNDREANERTSNTDSR